SRRRHTRFSRDWSSDVCSSDLVRAASSSAGGDRTRDRSGLVTLAAGRAAAGAGCRRRISRGRRGGPRTAGASRRVAAGGDRARRLAARPCVQGAAAMTLALRTLAVLIAIAGVIDPMLARQTAAPLAVEIRLPRPSDPRFASADAMRRDLVAALEREIEID